MSWTHDWFLRLTFSMLSEEPWSGPCAYPARERPFPHLNIPWHGESGALFGLQPPSTIVEQPVQHDPPTDAESDSQAVSQAVPEESGHAPDVRPPMPSLPRSLGAPTQMLVTDALLGQEQSKSVKEQAWLAGDEVWGQGLSVELGTVRYRGPTQNDSATASSSMVCVPVSAMFKRDKLNEVSRALTF